MSSSDEEAAVEDEAAELEALYRRTVAEDEQQPASPPDLLGRT